MTLRTALITLAATTTFVACGPALDPTSAEDQSDAVVGAGAGAVVCQNVFDAAVSTQIGVAPFLTLTWIGEDRALVAQDIPSLENSGRLTASGDVAHYAESFGDRAASFALVLRKRSQLLPGGSKLPLSSALDFEVLAGNGAVLTSFSVAPTECTTANGVATLTATGPDGSRLVLTMSRFYLGG